MNATKGASTRPRRRGTSLAEARSVRIDWPALLESVVSSASVPSPHLRTAARKTSFGRELEAALKQSTPVECDQDDGATRFESTAIAISMPLPDQVAALPGTRHDLHPPHVIERDVFVRVVAKRSEVPATLTPGTPSRAEVVESFQSEAKTPTEFGAVTRASAARATAKEAQPQLERSSDASEPSGATTALRANSFVPSLAVEQTIVTRPSDAVRQSSVDGLEQQPMLTPDDRPPLDSNDDKQRPRAHTASRDFAAAVVHAGAEVGIRTTTLRPVTDAASSKAVPNATSVVLPRRPEAAQSEAAPDRLDTSPAQPQAVVDSAAQRSTPDELPDSETKHPPSAESVATRDLVHAVGATRQDKPATVAHALEPAASWPAPRVSVGNAPGAANDRAVNRALEAVREITIDGLAQQKAMQPQRWSMLTAPTPPHADNSQADRGAHQGQASDSAPQDRGHADPATARESSAPAVRVDTHGGFKAALQLPATENAPSAPVPHAAAAASASLPQASPTAAAPLRLEVNPAMAPALIDQVVHRLLDTPVNGTVTLRLDPPELGTLLVRFQRRGSQLSVTLTAEREDVSRLLRQGLGQLQSSLSQLHEPVSVQVDTHGESRGRGDESALGSRRQRDPESRHNEPTHDQDTPSSRETPAQRAKRALRDARLDVWS